MGHEWITVRFCPSGTPTHDERLSFWRVPTIGELVHRDGDAFVVVDVDWQIENSRATPVVICHSLDRPRARHILGRDI